MNLHGIVKKIEQKHLRGNVADIRVGETVQVHYKIREGNKERVQGFEGLVVATKAGLSLQGSFTVRKVTSGVGVERTFPLHSPWIVKIERLKSGKVRQARLNFVRQHAMSSRFKLKDKGLAGTIWEEIAQEKLEIEKGDAGQAESVETEAKVEEMAEKTDNRLNDQAEQAAGEPSGEPGRPTSPEVGIEDSRPKPQN